MHLGGEFRVHLGGEFRLQLGGEFIFSIIPVVTLMHCSSSSSSWKRRSETLGIYHKKSKYLFAVQVFVAFFQPCHLQDPAFQNVLLQSLSNFLQFQSLWGRKTQFPLNCPHTFIHIKTVRMHLS